MSQDKRTLIQRILRLTEELYDMLIPSLPLERLTSDVTVVQLRVLLVLRTGGPSRMSAIASAAGIVPSTATGIVDNLVAKGLVLREDDPQDRRVVICRLSTEGQELVNGLWTWGQSQMEKLLHILTFEQLQNAYEVTEIIRNNAMKLTGRAEHK